MENPGLDQGPIRAPLPGPFTGEVQAVGLCRVPGSMPLTPSCLILPPCQAFAASDWAFPLSLVPSHPQAVPGSEQEVPSCPRRAGSPRGPVQTVA